MPLATAGVAQRQSPERFVLFWGCIRSVIGALPLDDAMLGLEYFVASSSSGLHCLGDFIMGAIEDQLLMLEGMGVVL